MTVQNRKLLEKYEITPKPERESIVNRKLVLNAVRFQLRNINPWFMIRGVVHQRLFPIVCRSCHTHTGFEAGLA
jgi:hypothetical protein